MFEPAPLSAADLAHRLGGRLEGDGARVVRQVGTLEEADSEMVSWLGRAELLPRLRRSRAGVVLVPLDCPVPAEFTVIRVADPDLALCDVLRCLAPPAETVPGGVHPAALVAADALVEGAAIGPAACIGPRATVGPGTQVHPGVRIGAEVEIGRDCVLWPNVVVRERVTIGDRVIIHPNATIGADGFGYLQRAGRQVKIPQVGTVVIEDDVEIGANTCIDRARSGVTRIGRGSKIDNLVQIGHNVTIGESCVIVAQCAIAGSTSLGHHVVLGGQVGISDHLRIGNLVQVAAKSAAMRGIPDGKAYRGIPARESYEFARQQVSLRRLPELRQQLHELVRRVEQLESATDDRTRG